MANPRYSQNISNLKQPSTAKGVSPKKAGSPHDSINTRTAAWPGLPGKAQPRDRSLGVPEEKVYAKAVGLRGGVDADDGPSGGPSHKDF